VLGLVIQNWKYLAMAALAAAAALFFANWQGAREEVGVWKTKEATQAAYSAGLRNQLAEANAKINDTAKAGAVSYGHCQDLVANDASKNFDLGVTFGRATCPAPAVK
jgi:hypothetical protein